MNVGLTHMTAIQMRHVRTVLAASVVRVTMASQELAPTAAVSEATHGSMQRQERKCLLLLIEVHLFCSNWKPSYKDPASNQCGISSRCNTFSSYDVTLYQFKM